MLRGLRANISWTIVLSLHGRLMELSCFGFVIVSLLNNPCSNRDETKISWVPIVKFSCHLDRSIAAFVIGKPSSQGPLGAIYFPILYLVRQKNIPTLWSALHRDISWMASVIFPSCSCLWEYTIFRITAFTWSIYEGNLSSVFTFSETSFLYVAWGAYFLQLLSSLVAWYFPVASVNLVSTHFVFQLCAWVPRKHQVTWVLNWGHLIGLESFWNEGNSQTRLE